MPKNLWMDMERVALRDVLFAFRSYFPVVDCSKLNGFQMRSVLAGELVVIKMGGRDRYELWPGKNFKSRLRKWNKHVAIPCVHIPALNGGGTKEKQAKQYGIEDMIELVGDGPRVFS
jgi:hypothetical protein